MPQSYNGVAGTVSVGCKNCSLVGTLEITDGTFTVSSSKSQKFSPGLSRTVNAVEDAVQFVEHGFFNIVANDVGGYMELDTSISLTGTQNFNKSIVDAALPGFQVGVFHSVPFKFHSRVN
jgi:hypothetical protein